VISQRTLDMVDIDPVTVRNPPPLFRYDAGDGVVQPIHIITDNVREMWPKASYSINEEVFVRLELGVYSSGPIILILPSEHGETVYVVRLGRKLVIRTKEA